MERDREKERERKRKQICIVGGYDMDGGRQTRKAERGRNVEVLRQSPREEKCERMFQERRDCEFKEACSCWHRAC